GAEVRPARRAGGVAGVRPEPGDPADFRSRLSEGQVWLGRRPGDDGRCDNQQSVGDDVNCVMTTTSSKATGADGEAGVSPRVAVTSTGRFVPVSSLGREGGRRPRGRGCTIFACGP
ncbi:hypothetical protein THAOC_27022, partial [Thalassiosira oceanica]